MTGVFQGLLLFTLLACDTLIHYRIRWQAARLAPKAAAAIVSTANTATNG